MPALIGSSAISCFAGRWQERSRCKFSFRALSSYSFLSFGDMLLFGDAATASRPRRRFRVISPLMQRHAISYATRRAARRPPTRRFRLDAIAFRYASPAGAAFKAGFSTGSPTCFASALRRAGRRIMRRARRGAGQQQVATISFHCRHMMTAEHADAFSPRDMSIARRAPPMPSAAMR